MNESITDFINNIMEKYGFAWLNQNSDKEIVFEYMGDDIEYRQNFSNKLEYENFAKEQAKIVCKNFDNIKKEIENNNFKIKVKELEWDIHDYPCVYIIWE